MSRLPRLASSLLLCCAALLPAPAPAGAAGPPVADEAPDSAPEFTLVTLNLYHDRDDWPKRRVQIVDTLRALEPDAIVLQEVLQHEGLPNQATWLARELGYHWHFVTTDPPSHARRYGNALLSRQPLIEQGETLLHPLEDHRTAGMARVLVDGRPLNLYFTHLHSAPDGGAIRAGQLADLMAYVGATSDGIASAIAGDFNAEPGAPELAALREGWDDAWAALHADVDEEAASTLNPAYFASPARIDHVFLQRGLLHPLEAELLFTTPDAAGTWASDHRGLRVRFRIDDPATP